MRLKCWLLSVGLLGLLSGCEAADSGFVVGDEIDGGKVTEVTGTGACRVVTVQFDPEWSCSEEQLELISQGGGYYPEGSPSVPDDVPVDEAAAIELRATDCFGEGLRKGEVRHQRRSDCRL